MQIIKLKNKLIYITLGLYFVGIFISGCNLKLTNNKKKEYFNEVNRSFVEHIKKGRTEIFKINFDRYKVNLKSYPIGVFDSGIGGLTVFKEILQIDHFNNITHKEGPDNIPDFSSEHFIYLADQANMPYGAYPSLGKVDFLRELIIRDAVFLLGSRYWPSEFAKLPLFDKPPVKSVVIACNTATSYGLDMLRAAFKEWGLPVYIVGVVEAGSKGAIEALERREKPGTIAVMATVGTILSNGYPKAMEKAASKASIKNLTVIQEGSIGIAGAVEGDEAFIIDKNKRRTTEYKGPSINNPEALIDMKTIQAYAFDFKGIIGDKDNPSTWELNSVENYIRYDVTTLVEKYKKSAPNKPISVVVLGCTHYPFYMDSFTNTFKRLKNFEDDDGDKPYFNLIDEDLIFIDPSELTAIELYKHLSGKNLLLEGRENSLIKTNEFYISVPNRSIFEGKLTLDGSFTYEYKYGRSAGNFNIEDVKLVPMSNYNLNDFVQKNIINSMPFVWKSLVEFNWQSTRTKNLPENARLKMMN